MLDKLNRHQFLVVSVIIAIGASSAVADSPLKLRVSGRAELPVPSRTVRFSNDQGRPVILNAIAADSTSGTIAVAGDDNQIRIVQAATLQTIKTLKGHRDRIRTLEFAPDGKRLVSAGNDGQIIVWDSGEDYAIRQRMEGTPAMARVCFAPSGKEMAAVGFDSEVYIIGRKGRGRPTMTCDCRDLRAVAYSDDENMLAVAGRSGDLHLFELETGKLVGEYPIHRGRIDDVVFSRSSNHLISVGEDGRLVSFDTDAGQIIRRTKITSCKLFAIAMLDSRLAAVAGSDNVIRIVNVDNGQIVRSLEGHRGSIPTLAASDGYLFSGGFDATLRRWSIADLQFKDERIAETDDGKNRE